MEEKLYKLFNDCILELETIGYNFRNNPEIGDIDIKISTRKVKRYGCCRQEEPDKNSSSIKRTKKGFKIIYNKYKKHHIEISSWVMNLDDYIIKNTIIHELLHCLPYCNNHGPLFRGNAKCINLKLGYNIKTVGNVEEDYKKSNLEFKEEACNYKYKIICKQCGAIIYRKKLKKNLITKYRCGKCGGRLQVNN